MATATENYVKAIRNAAKRKYAQAYLAYLQNDMEGPEPERPASLSTMAAQAVRIQLRIISAHS